MATADRANNFNLIRLILASLVILAHSPEMIDGDRHRELAARLFGTWTSLGELAVAGFFILSGYLITQSWLRDPWIPAYVWRRILRIYPGFLVAGLLSGLVLAPLGTNPRYWDEWNGLSFIKGLIKLTLQLPAAFAAVPYPMINGPVWTIQYEFVCYFLLLGLGVMGLLRSRRLLLGLALLATGWAGAQASGLIPPLAPFRWIDGDHRQIPRLLSCFLAGVVGSLFEDRLGRNRWWVVGLAGAALAGGLNSPWLGTILLPWLGGLLLLAAGRAPLVPATAWVRRDDVSYGVYLYAWPIQMFLMVRLGVRNPWLLFGLALPLALGAGWTSWRFVEKPALRLKGWFYRRVLLLQGPA